MPLTGPFPINYCNDRYPMLSFAYAVYCGRNKAETFMDHENKQVRETLHAVPTFVPGDPPGAAVAADPSVYRGYLKYYTTNQGRRFPAAGVRIVSLDVIQNPEPFWNPTRDLTSPTKLQCESYVNLLMLELCGKDAPQLEAGESSAQVTDPRPARANARRDDFRPILSCMSVIFLNDDASFRANPSAFLADYELSNPAIAALTAFGQRLNGVVGPIPAAGPWLTDAEAATLAPELSDDLAKDERQFLW